MTDTTAGTFAGTFAGKVALVTGATSGIGRATALLLATRGARVAVNHRPGSDPRGTLDAIVGAGGEAFPVAADMRDPAAVIAMVADVARIAGRLDLLVSNAAINPLRDWHETTVEHWDELSETNLRGTWVVATEAAKQMIAERHGGAIVCVSSISAHVGAPGQVAYCATKGGISMLAKALGAVLGEHGIRINAIEPGAVDTRMAAPLLAEQAALTYYLNRIPLQRIAQPDELARVIAFLLFDEASYVNGATLLVDGGFIVNAEL